MVGASRILMAMAVAREAGEGRLVASIRINCGHRRYPKMESPWDLLTLESAGFFVRRVRGSSNKVCR